MHGSELASLDAALRAAGTKVEHAKSALAIELQRLDAVKLRSASHAFTVHMKKIDKALDDMVNALFDVEPIRQHLDALGVGPPMTLSCWASVPFCWRAARFRGQVWSRSAPANERTTFTQLAQAWAR